MPLAALEHRLEQVRDALARNAADWLLVPASADFRWLTGALARATERLVAFCLPRSGEPFCVVPRLESDALAHECPGLELEVWEDGQDPFERLARRVDLSRRPPLLLGEGFRTAALLRLATSAHCRSAADVLGPLRAVKDAAEIGRMQEAARHADRVVEEAADHARPGMSEREVARFVLTRFEELGDAEPWAIVASGPSSALPHHTSSGRRLREGEVLLLDVGAFTGGYGSDITRTYFLGDPPKEVRRVFEVVDRARRAAIAAAGHGVPAERVDAAARDVIRSAGWGERFLHRTGHGLGLEVHEPPYLTAGNPAPLHSGMVHSVEPGIYLEGRFGVRLEDIVAVQDGGALALNRAPLDLRPPRLRG